MPNYLITGANRGLGLEFVRQLARDPSNTILACVRHPDVDLDDLKRAGSGSTHQLICDTGSLESLAALPSAVADKLARQQGDGDCGGGGGGSGKLDYVINNAAINDVPRQTSLSIVPEDLDRHVRVNVVGPAKTTEHLLSAGLLGEGVRVVNVTSGLASMAVSLSTSPRLCATYAISKAALNALTVQQSGDLRARMGPAVVVVCVDPGWVRTRMGGEASPLEPEVSVRGVLECIHGLKEDDNGKFLTYTGKEVPW